MRNKDSFSPHPETVDGRAVKAKVTDKADMSVFSYGPTTPKGTCPVRHESAWLELGQHVVMESTLDLTVQGNCTLVYARRCRRRRRPVCAATAPRPATDRGSPWRRRATGAQPTRPRMGEGKTDPRGAPFGRPGRQRVPCVGAAAVRRGRPPRRLAAARVNAVDRQRRGPRGRRHPRPCHRRRRCRRAVTGATAGEGHPHGAAAAPPPPHPCSRAASPRPWPLSGSAAAQGAVGGYLSALPLSQDEPGFITTKVMLGAGGAAADSGLAGQVTLVPQRKRSRWTPRLGAATAQMTPPAPRLAHQNVVVPLWHHQGSMRSPWPPTLRLIVPKRRPLLWIRPRWVSMVFVSRALYSASAWTTL